MAADPRDVRRAARVFKALSHPDRLHLTCLLAERSPRTQKELVDELGWPQSTVARHLAVLRERGLVEGHRQGAEVLLEAATLPRLLMDTVCGALHGAEESGEKTAGLERTAS